MAQETKRVPGAQQSTSIVETEHGKVWVKGPAWSSSDVPGGLPGNGNRLPQDFSFSRSTVNPRNPYGWED